MSSIFGTIIPASNVEKILREESYWKNQYDTLNKASQDINTQLSAAVRGANFDFSKNAAIMQRVLSKDILRAYDESFDQKSAILSSNLGQGYKTDLVGDLDSALNDAYESYLLNYQQDKLANERQLDDTIAAYEQNAAKAQAQVDAQREMLDKSISEESKYMSEFYNSIPEYLDWLYAQEDESVIDAFTKGKWNEYFTNQDGYRGGKTIVGQDMYDADNNLTRRGFDIINMLFSDPLAQQNVMGYSYQDYLEKNNRTKLSEWLSSTSNYSTEDDIFSNYAYALRQYGITEPNYKFYDDVKEVVKPEDVSSVFNDTHPDLPKLEADSNGTNYYRGYDFGTIAVYEGDNRIIAFNDLTLGADKTINDRDGESFTVKYTDDAGTVRKYRLELADADSGNDVVVDSNNAIYKDIAYRVGSIKENQIYAYGNNVYAGVKSDTGSIILRKLQSSGNNKTYDIFVKTMTNKAQWGTRYNRGQIQNNITPSDGSLEKSAKEILEKEIEAITKEALRASELKQRRNSNAMKYR